MTGMKGGVLWFSAFDTPSGPRAFGDLPSSKVKSRDTSAWFPAEKPVPAHLRDRRLKICSLR